MSLRDRILSDINIYAAIHALPNTLKEKSLICDDHQQYLKDLREIYRYGASHDKFITRCKDKFRIRYYFEGFSQIKTDITVYLPKFSQNPSS